MICVEGAVLDEHILVVHDDKHVCKSVCVLMLCNAKESMLETVTVRGAQGNSFRKKAS